VIMTASKPVIFAAANRMAVVFAAVNRAVEADSTAADPAVADAGNEFRNGWQQRCCQPFFFS